MSHNRASAVAWTTIFVVRMHFELHLAADFAFFGLLTFFKGFPCKKTFLGLLLLSLPFRGFPCNPSIWRALILTHNFFLFLLKEFELLSTRYYFCFNLTQKSMISFVNFIRKLVQIAPIIDLRKYKLIKRSKIHSFYYDSDKNWARSFNYITQLNHLENCHNESHQDLLS